MVALGLQLPGVVQNLPQPLIEGLTKCAAFTHLDQAQSSPLHHAGPRSMHLLRSVERWTIMHRMQQGEHRSVERWTIMHRMQQEEHRSWPCWIRQKRW
jgi:hypothetical protein